MNAKELGAQSAHPWTDNSGGLTKRELFAAMAMQGYLAHGFIDYGTHTGQPIDESAIARQALANADALLAELAKESQP